MFLSFWFPDIYRNLNECLSNLHQRHWWSYRAAQCTETSCSFCQHLCTYAALEMFTCSTQCDMIAKSLADSGVPHWFRPWFSVGLQSVTVQSFRYWELGTWIHLWLIWSHIPWDSCLLLLQRESGKCLTWPSISQVELPFMAWVMLLPSK